MSAWRAVGLRHTTLEPQHHLPLMIFKRKFIAAASRSRVYARMPLLSVAIRLLLTARAAAPTSSTSSVYRCHREGDRGERVALLGAVRIHAVARG